METVACNCCGSDRLRAVYTMPDALFPTTERFTVMECLDCGLGFVILVRREKRSSVLPDRILRGLLGEPLVPTSADTLGKPLTWRMCRAAIPRGGCWTSAVLVETFPASCANGAGRSKG